MKRSWQNRKDPDIMTLENLIRKDVTRTDSCVKFLDNKQNSLRRKLLNILMSYCICHSDVGYRQG